MRYAAVVALVLTLAGSLHSQDRVFNWVVASEEAVRLDPAFYHTGRVYRPGSSGGKIHVKIRAEHPVTIAMTWVSDWDEERSDPAMASRTRWRCVLEHVVDTMYECQLPPSDVPMVLTIRDERYAQGAILSGVGAVLQKGHVARPFLSPNDVSITYHRWDCVENCIQPEFQWIRLVKEKYQLTSTPKVYSLFSPETDGQELSVKIKAPVPMTVAVIPTELADQLYEKPENLGVALSSTKCKQRGVQQMSFECSLSLADGHQSLLVVPESPRNAPHKKAEIELQAVKCVANCNMLNPGN